MDREEVDPEAPTAVRFDARARLRLLRSERHSPMGVKRGISEQSKVATEQSKVATEERKDSPLEKKRLSVGKKSCYGAVKRFSLRKRSCYGAIQ